MKTAACPYITSAFELLSKKWTGVILHTLSLSENNEMHFTDLKSAINHITPRILSMRLNEMIDDQLVDKVESETHHVYRLTQKGSDLVNALKEIESWAHQYLEVE